MKRTAKNYNGTRFPAKKMETLLPEILKSLKKETGSLEKEIRKAWASLVGTKISQYASVHSFREGILKITVRSASLYNLMMQHEKKVLLKKLQQMFPNQIKDIIFKVG